MRGVGVVDDAQLSLRPVLQRCPLHNLLALEWVLHRWLPEVEYSCVLEKTPAQNSSKKSDSKDIS